MNAKWTDDKIRECCMGYFITANLQHQCAIEKSVVQALYMDDASVWKMHCETAVLYCK